MNAGQLQLYANCVVIGLFGRRMLNSVRNIFMSYRTAADLPRHFGDPRRTTVSNRRTYSTMVQNGPEWSHGVSWAAWEGLWRSSEGAWGPLGRS